MNLKKFKLIRNLFTASYLLHFQRKKKSLIWNNKPLRAITIMLAKQALGRGVNNGPSHKITTSITKELKIDES
jgi:hypothetical protein